MTKDSAGKPNKRKSGTRKRKPTAGPTASPGQAKKTAKKSPVALDAQPEPASAGQIDGEPKAAMQPTPVSTGFTRGALSELNRLSPLQKMLAVGGLLGLIVASVQLGFWTRDVTIIVLDTVAAESIAKEVRGLNPNAEDDDVTAAIEGINALLKQASEMGGAQRERARQAVEAARNGDLAALENFSRQIFEETRRIHDTAREVQARTARNLAAVVKVRSMAEAIQWYGEAVRLDPHDLKSWRELTRAELKAGTLAGAREAAEAYLEQATVTGSARARMLALFELGNVLLSQNQLGTAKQVYDEGLEIAEGLQAGDAPELVWDEDLVVALVKVGDVEMENRNFSGALDYHSKALELARRLLVNDTGNLEGQLNVAKIIDRVGDEHSALQQPESAMRHYEEALRMKRAILKEDPDHQDAMREVTVTLARIGNLLELGQDTEGALRAYRAGLELSRKLHAMDRSIGRRARDVSVYLNKIGALLERGPRPLDAMPLFAEALQIRRQLYAKDSDNPIRAADVSGSLVKIGNLLSKTGDLEGALSPYQEAHAVQIAIVARQPQDPGERYILYSISAGIGQTFEELLRKTKACRYYGEANDLIAALIADFPNTRSYTNDRDWLSGRMLAAECRT